MLEMITGAIIMLLGIFIGLALAVSISNARNEE